MVNHSSDFSTGWKNNGLTAQNQTEVSRLHMRWFGTGLNEINKNRKNGVNDVQYYNRRNKLTWYLTEFRGRRKRWTNFFYHVLSLPLSFTCFILEILNSNKSLDISVVHMGDSQMLYHGPQGLFCTWSSWSNTFLSLYFSHFNEQIFLIVYNAFDFVLE